MEALQSDLDHLEQENATLKKTVKKLEKSGATGSRFSSIQGLGSERSVALGAAEASDVQVRLATSHLTFIHSTDGVSTIADRLSQV